MNSSKFFKVCFTGHRPNKLSWKYNEELDSCKKFKFDIENMLIKAIKNNYCYFISGMALGIDIICAEIVLKLKNIYKNVKLECAIPCFNQTKFWNEKDKIRYENIIKKCDKITYVSSCNYYIGCNQKRNVYMVDNSNAVIAVWNGYSSGTKNTIDYAKQKNLKIKIIDINSYK